MARYRRYRRYRRGYRRWRRWRRGRSRYSGSRRIINNSSRTRVSIKCKATQDVSLAIGAQHSWSQLLVATPWIANRTVDLPAANQVRPEVFCAGIINTPAFTSFASVYDEVRLTGVRYVIQCRSHVGEGGFPAVTFHSCWERSKSLNSFVNRSPNAVSISTSPSAQSVTAIANTVNKFSRSCYPSDLFERIDFANSYVYDHDINVNEYNIPPGDTYSAVPTKCLVAAGQDPYEGHPSFFPVLYMAANVHGTTTVNRYIALTITCYCTFEFRGPKYGNASTASASLAVKGANMGGPAPDADDNAPPAAQAAAAAAAAANQIEIDDSSDEENMLDADEAQAQRHVSRALATTVIRDPVTSVQRDSTRQRSRDRSRSRSRARQAMNNVARAARFVNEHPAARYRVLNALDAAGVPGAGRANAIMDVVDAVADAVRDDRGDDEPPELPPDDEL